MTELLLFFLFFPGSLAAGAGLGGGGLLVPVFIIMGLPAKNAIPLSEATIFG